MNDGPVTTNVHLRRTGMSLVAAAALAAAVLSGCGSNSSNSIESSAKEQIEAGTKQAEEGLKEGTQAAEKAINEAKSETNGQGSKQIKEGLKKAEEGVQQGKSQAEKQIEEAKKRIEEQTE